MGSRVSLDHLEKSTVLSLPAVYPDYGIPGSYSTGVTEQNYERTEACVGRLVVCFESVEILHEQLRKAESVRATRY